MAEPALYVGDFEGATISVVDVASATLARTIPMGEAEIAGLRVPIQVDSFAKPAGGEVLYLSRFPAGAGLGALPGGKATPGDVAALNLRTGELDWVLPIDGKPNHVSVSADGATLFVPVRDRCYVDLVDTRAGAVTGRINCGWGPHGTELSADGHLLYVGTIWQDTLDVLDVVAGRPVRSIPLGAPVRPFTVTADDRLAYVQLSRLHGFVVVDLAEGRRLQTVHLPGEPKPGRVATEFSYLIDHGIRLRRGADELWVAGTSTDYLAVYEVPSLALKKIIEVGRAPAYLEFSADEALCFASNREEDTVSIVDAAALTEIARVPVGAYPNRMKYVAIEG